MGEKTERGFSATELIVVISIGIVLVATTIPMLSVIQRKRALRAAAAELCAVFRTTRQLAVTRSRNMAVRFLRDADEWNYAIYQDGDWDGVLNQDIAAGTDRLIGAPRRVLEGSRVVRIGLPQLPITDPDSGKLMAPHATPVRFNQSRLCSFSPYGEGTSGSVFITDGRGAAVVRVLGASGRIRFQTWDGSKGWK